MPFYYTGSRQTPGFLGGKRRRRGEGILSKNSMVQVRLCHVGRAPGLIWLIAIKKERNLGSYERG